MKNIKYILLLLIIPISLNADSLERCIDGDTAAFNVDGKIEKVRFLGIDTPESTNKIEPYGKEASEFTCDRLKNAQIIKLELDKNSNEYDKYGRLLAWIFIDDKLLQEEILKKGFGEVKYIYGDYKYLNEIKEAENYAKEKKLGIYSEMKEENNQINIIILIVLFLILIYLGKKKEANKILKMIIKNKWFDICFFYYGGV